MGTQWTQHMVCSFSNQRFQSTNINPVKLFEIKRQSLCFPFIPNSSFLYSLNASHARLVRQRLDRAWVLHPGFAPWFYNPFWPCYISSLGSENFCRAKWATYTMLLSYLGNNGSPNNTLLLCALHMSDHYI